MSSKASKASMISLKAACLNKIRFRDLCLVPKVILDHLRYHPDTDLLNEISTIEFRGNKPLCFTEHSGGFTCECCEKKVITLAHPACMYWHYCEKHYQEGVLQKIKYYKKFSNIVECDVFDCGFTILKLRRPERWINN